MEDSNSGEAKILLSPGILKLLSQGSAARASPPLRIAFAEAVDSKNRLTGRVARTIYCDVNCELNLNLLLSSALLLRSAAVGV